MKTALLLTLLLLLCSSISWAQTTSSASSRRSSILLAQIPGQDEVRVAPTNPNALNPNTLPQLNNRPPSVRPKRSIPPTPAGTGTAGSAPAPRAPEAPTAPPEPPVAAAPTPAAAPVVPPPQPAGDSSAIPPDDQPIEVETSDMSQVMEIYEVITTKKVIKDVNLADVPFPLSSQGELPPAKALAFIEASLLLNGYAIIPAGEDFVKFVNTGAIKVPTEMQSVITEESMLPKGEVVVTYVQPLQYLDAEDVKKSLEELAPKHAYGVISTLPNSRGIIITENSHTVRYFIELLKHLDVEPSRTNQKSFQLIRSSAEDVAKALSDILDLEGKSNKGSGGSGGSGGASSQPSIPQPTGIPNQPGNPAQGGAAPIASSIGGGPQGAATPPKLIPIPRTNKLLVVARPIDMAYIETLIEELDGASEMRNFVSYKLKYLGALDVLPIVENAITRGMDEGGSGGSSGSGLTSGGQRENSSANNSQRNIGSNSNSGFGSSNSSFGGGFGSSGGLGGSSGLGGGGGGQVQEIRQGADPTNPRPESLLVGKTLLIADPVQNEIFMSGPPDHLEIMQQVLAEIDKRPRSVVISAVIGQLQLNNDQDVGIDYIFRPNEVRFNNMDALLAGGAINRVGSQKSFVDSGTVTDIAKIAEAAGGFSLFGAIEDQVNVAISALQRTGNFKVLSRPTLHTLNNKPADIFTGVSVPVPTSTLGSFQGGAGSTVNNGFNTGFQSNIGYQEVKLQLSVVPLIVGDNEVMLSINQTNNTLAGTTTISGNAIPNINNQGLQTTVTVKDGSAVLLGGLIQETTEKERAGIPILKDLPLIKYIASSQKDNKKRNELLVFIQPRIIHGNGDTPPDEKDPVGNSPLGEEMRKFFSNEHQDPEADAKSVKRSRISQMLRKVFN